MLWGLFHMTSDYRQSLLHRLLHLLSGNSKQLLSASMSMLLHALYSQVQNRIINLFFLVKPNIPLSFEAIVNTIYHSWYVTLQS